MYPIFRQIVVTMKYGVLTPEEMQNCMLHVAIRERYAIKGIHYADLTRSRLDDLLAKGRDEIEPGLLPREMLCALGSYEPKPKEIRNYLWLEDVQELLAPLLPCERVSRQHLNRGLGRLIHNGFVIQIFNQQNQKATRYVVNSEDLLKSYDLGNLVWTLEKTTLGHVTRRSGLLMIHPSPAESQRQRKELQRLEAQLAPAIRAFLMEQYSKQLQTRTRSGTTISAKEVGRLSCPRVVIDLKPFLVNLLKEMSIKEVQVRENHERPCGV
jgi:hypothetical protein